MKTIRYITNSAGQQEAVEDNRSYQLPVFDNRIVLNAASNISDSSLGVQRAIDTLTYIKSQVTTQKFYTLDIANIIPVAIGDGSMNQNILTNIEVSAAGPFEAGVINTGSNNDRLATAQAAVTSKTVKITNWAKQIGYSLFDVGQALAANNWDYIEAQHRARKTNWDLGIQEIAMLGSLGDPDGTPGLLTNADVNVNTSFITAPISGLNAANFNTFIAGLISTYFTNTNSTAMPDTFVIPYNDYLGLQVPFPGTVGTYPLAMLSYIEMAFKAATGNSGFRIIPSAYNQAGNNSKYTGSNGKNIYALFRYDPTSIRMDIPTFYTTTQANSLNNFQFQDVAYGQYTGVGVYRPLEYLRFEYAA